MSGVPPTTASDPARRSFAQLKRYVADYVQAPDDVEALDVAGYGINSGVDYLNFHQWHKELGTQDITPIADTYGYSLNSDFKDPHSVALLTSASVVTKRLLPEDYWIDRRSRLLVFNVAPTASFAGLYPIVRLYYYRRFARLVESDQVFDGMAEFETFLGWYGRAELATVRRPSAAPYAQSMWREIFRGLRADQNNLLSDYGE